MTATLDLVVVGRAAAAEPLAMAGALALAGRALGPPVVLLWRGADQRTPAALPATPGARRAAAALTARGVSATGCGRVVRVLLPAGAVGAAAEVQRVAAATRGPVVFALCGPREDALDALLLDAADVVYAGDGAAAVGALVVEELAVAGVPVRVAPPLSGIGAFLARTGVAASAPECRVAGERGQALMTMFGGLLAVVAGALVLGWLATALSVHGAHQRAADLAALAGARALLDARPRVLASGTTRLAPAAYLALARDVAERTARRNGAQRTQVSFGAGALPDRVRIVVRDGIPLPGGIPVSGRVVAEAQIAAMAMPLDDGTYAGPLATRQGKPMRPDVALGFDRLAAAARRGGIGLIVVSAFRTDAEQARLFAAHPDPKWVAPPGKSLHRLGTELDLGPAGAYRWLAAHAGAFGFVQRYSWEPWHFGFGRSPGSASVGFGLAAGGVPGFVPLQYRAALRSASQRWSVGAALLAAQLQQESGFDPASRSPAGALGIAQFMPGTARTYGLHDPFDAVAAIDAQAHLMHDLLRRFGSVPLALAAYNAGEGRVASCLCVPPIAETQAYVLRIVALARGAGADIEAGGPPVRLIR